MIVFISANQGHTTPSIEEMAQEKFLLQLQERVNLAGHLRYHQVWNHDTITDEAELEPQPEANGRDAFENRPDGSGVSERTH